MRDQSRLPPHCGRASGLTALSIRAAGSFAIFQVMDVKIVI